MYPLVQRFVTAAVCTILTSEESYPKPVLFVQAWWSIHITSKRTGWYWYHHYIHAAKMKIAAHFDVLPGVCCCCDS